jgi:hypothetical protein
MLAGYRFMTSCMRPLYDFSHGSSRSVAYSDIMSVLSLLLRIEAGRWALGEGAWDGCGLSPTSVQSATKRHEQGR